MKGRIDRKFDRGFGFIVGEDGKEYFFHVTGLKGGLQFDDLVAKMQVEFEPTISKSGYRAENIYEGNS